MEKKKRGFLILVILVVVILVTLYVLYLLGYKPLEFMYQEF